MTDIKRIGRPANPAERGLQLATETPDVLQAMASEVFMEETNQYTEEGLAAFNALSDDEQEKWRQRALEIQREHIAQYQEPTDPDDPDPGASRPTEITRVA